MKIMISHTNKKKLSGDNNLDQIKNIFSLWDLFGLTESEQERKMFSLFGLMESGRKERKGKTES